MAIFFLFVGQNQHIWYQMTCNGAGFPEKHNLLCFQSKKEKPLSWLINRQEELNEFVNSKIILYPRVTGFRTIIDFPICQLTVLTLHSYDNWNFQRMAS